jgi:hypothetical protein
MDGREKENERVTNIDRFDEATERQMGKCQRRHAVLQPDNDDRFGLIEYALHGRRSGTLSNSRFEYYARNDERARALCAFTTSFDRPSWSIHMERV